MRKLKGELIKTCKLPVVYITTIVSLVLNLALFFWMAYLSDDMIRQDILCNADKAGYFSLGVFANVFRKIWASIVGCYIIGSELESNSKHFSIQNQGKIGFFLYKGLCVSILSFLMVMASYVLSFLGSIIFTGTISQDFSFLITISQIFYIWLMTLGFCILTMCLTQVTRKTIPIILIFFLLEFSGQFFPDSIKNIWYRVDGYWYFSNLLAPIKENLREMHNFSFSISSQYSGYTGLFIWFLLVILLIVGISLFFYKQEEK